MSEWKTIDAAPKDRAILGFGEFDYPVAIQWLHIEIDGFEWNGWSYCDELLRDVFPSGPLVTHWMPLPKPPETTP